MRLDEAEKQTIKCLQDDGRMDLMWLAEQENNAEFTVRSRVQSMIEKGILDTAKLDTLQFIPDSQVFRGLSEV